MVNKNKERSVCRKKILEWLDRDKNLDLFKVAFWHKYKHSPYSFTSGMMLQAKRMLDEEGLDYSHLIKTKKEYVDVEEKNKRFIEEEQLKE